MVLIVNLRYKLFNLIINTMRNFTSFLCTLFLCICTMQLNAQIINENFNSSPWESAKAATSVSEVTTDNGIWRVYNTEINIEQTGASPATNGALIFPKNSLTPNLDTRPYVDVPAIEKGGVKTIELLARYGDRKSVV